MRWFKHDSEASTDAKLMKVRHKYGMVGYGLYWYCLECIARNVSTSNITFELEHDAETIAREFNLDQYQVEEMMGYMVGLGLFENDFGRVTCLKMAFRLDDTNSKNPQIKHIQDQLRSTSEQLRETPRNSGQIRSDQTRSDEKRKDQNKTKGAKAPSKFIPPSVEEVREYCQQRGNNIDPESFVAHYEANGWFRGKTKIKNWKSCVITWEKRHAANQSANQQGRKLSVSERATEARRQWERENPDT